MPLGPDPTVCTEQFVAAMRARLDELDPPAGANADLPDVRANLAALATGVYLALTGPGLAQTSTGPAEDAGFWRWVAELTAEVAALRSWQQGVTAAFTTWAPADAPGLALKAALLALPQPGPVPAAPSGLVGRIR
jgi:hypothetical protein